MKKAWSQVREWLAHPLEPFFAIGLVAIVGWGSWLRAQGLSSGTLFRDDAWVALTSKVSFGTAWRMVGTAPGFVVIERWWVSLTHDHLWLMQLPTFAVSVAGLLLLGGVARWWGLGRLSSLLVVGVIAFSRIDITYATHLKPYAHDIVAATLLLASARWFQRDGSPAWFAGVAALCLVTSFSVFPLVLGIGLWMGVVAWRRHTLRPLAVAALAAIIPVGLVAWAIRGGISPRLDQSWRASYVDFHSLTSFVRSLNAITTSLLWGSFDTTPGLGIPFLGRVTQLVVIALILLSLRRWKDTAILWVGLLGAYLACLLHLAPLGTGRTDAYLHPTLALLTVIGGVELISLVRGRLALTARLATAGLVALLILSGVDRSNHPTPYAGGNFRPVLWIAQSALKAHVAVLVEGTARWPWAYYGAKHLSIRFSSQYNTGFAPVSHDPHVVVMPGSSIEGGYNPRRAVALLGHARAVMYIQSDDWTAMGHPLQQPLRDAGYRPITPLVHVPGYWWQYWGSAEFMASAASHGAPIAVTYEPAR